MECSETTEIIEKKVCVQAEIRVIPEAGVGAILLECIGEPRREPCEGTVCSICDFVISQMICLKIPIRFSADAEVVTSGIACEKVSPDYEPHPSGDAIGYRQYMDNRRYPGNAARSFTRNYLMTHRNNPTT